MHMLADLSEAALFIEISSHLVVLEYIQLKKISLASRVVHQRPPDSPAMVIRIDENRPDFIPDQRNKTHHNSILLEDPRFGVWQMDLADSIPFLPEKRLVEEWMANQ